MSRETVESPEAAKEYRSQRKLKNYLINKRFQLKYTLMIASLTTILVIILGFVIFRTVSQASDQLAACVLGDETYASDDQVDLLRASLAADKRKALYILFGFLFLLLFGITLSGIYITHKVAGPMFKIQKLMRDVDSNNLLLLGKLRKGDELLELFEDFDAMINRLRDGRKTDIEKINEVAEQLREAPEKGTIKDVVASLEKMKEAKQVSLK
ncbi:MAG: hypothetical protein ABIJ56_23730 [Pseudomonadota bacterium]